MAVEGQVSCRPVLSWMADTVSVVDPAEDPGHAYLTETDATALTTSQGGLTTAQTETDATALTTAQGALTTAYGDPHRRGTPRQRPRRGSPGA